jgi:hypothetical protein
MLKKKRTPEHASKVQMNCHRACNKICVTAFQRLLFQERHQHSAHCFVCSEQSHALYRTSAFFLRVQSEPVNIYSLTVVAMSLCDTVISGFTDSIHVSRSDNKVASSKADAVLNRHISSITCFCHYICVYLLCPIWAKKL